MEKEELTRPTSPWEYGRLMDAGGGRDIFFSGVATGRSLMLRWVTLRKPSGSQVKAISQYNPDTHMVKGENCYLKIVLWPTNEHRGINNIATTIYIAVYTHTHMYVYSDMYIVDVYSLCIYVC